MKRLATFTMACLAKAIEMLNMKVLIVDDDKGMADTLSDILELKGFKTATSESGERALEAIHSDNFDCVLSDIKMPGMTGIELNKAIKQSKPDLPVVFMTAYTEEHSLEEGINEGAVSYLEKPVDIEKLLSFLALLKRINSLLIVDNDPAFCENLSNILRQQGFLTQQLINPLIAVDDIESQDQIVILNLTNGGTKEGKIINELRKRDVKQPIILITDFESRMSPEIRKFVEKKEIKCFERPVDYQKFTRHLKSINLKRLRRIFK